VKIVVLSYPKVIVHLYNHRLVGIAQIAEKLFCKVIPFAQIVVIRLDMCQERLLCKFPNKLYHV